MELAVKCELPQDQRVSFEMRYQPRDMVGGNFFQGEQGSADHYAILVADAKGHGVAAALYTRLLWSLCQERRTDLVSPARCMGILNERVQVLGRDEGYFGTAVLAAYGAASGELRLVHAGHPAPLLFRAAGTVEAIGCANPALGMLPSSDYRETTARLTPRDALLLYTAGATELFDG